MRAAKKVYRRQRRVRRWNSRVAEMDRFQRECRWDFKGRLLEWNARKEPKKRNG